MRPMTITILGLGDRGLQVYANIIRQYPDRLKLVAVADLAPERVQTAAEESRLAGGAVKVLSV